jgi:hypothetical protein
VSTIVQRIQTNNLQTDHCGTGCQSGFGNCGGNGAVSSKAATSTVKPVTSTVKTSAAPTATTASKVSTDGTCAGTGKMTCVGSTFGNCCSQNGWCGATSDYCGTGCQTGFGTCGSASASKAANPATTKPAATSAAAKKVSTDGSCAGTGGFTCKGSSFGNCCSQYGWCGSTTGHCTSGCQSGFGTCS